MLPEQIIEQHIAFGGEIRSVPPEPIAALGGVDFTQRGFARPGVECGQFLFEIRAGLAEQVPSAVFLLIANPYVEVAANPRSAVQRRDGALRRAAVQVVFNRATAEPRIVLKSTIQIPQERLAAIAELLPAILAVEDDGNQTGVRGQLIREMAEVHQQMFRGLMRLISPRHEADEIAERFLAENRIYRRVPVLDPPALEEFEMIRMIAGTAQGIEEVLLVGAEVFDSRFAHQRHKLWCYTAFARPQSARCTAEHPRVLLRCEPQLREGILRPVEA